MVAMVRSRVFCRGILQGTMGRKSTKAAQTDLFECHCPLFDRIISFLLQRFERI